VHTRPQERGWGSSSADERKDTVVHMYFVVILSYCSQPQSQLENSFGLLANETLESLGDKFNELIEENSQLAQGDVTLGK
jgi:hypothetical protein